MENVSQYNVIFLDIQMPDMNGMKVARKIREKDENVLIVFVTNMAQYAAESYEVHAYDFILKPVLYGNFFMKFRRILKALEHTLGDACITLATRYEKKRVRVSDITYVEICNHDLIFYLSDGEIRITGKTMNEIETELAAYHFVRCSSSFLVNLKYASALHGEYVTVGGNELHISRSKRQPFLTEFAKYAGGSV
jgi:DNA-binding LytR/AlgR family response regulator